MEPARLTGGDLMCSDAHLFAAFASGCIIGAFALYVWNVLHEVEEADRG